jgi:hypothetical protein
MPSIRLLVCVAGSLLVFGVACKSPSQPSDVASFVTGIQTTDATAVQATQRSGRPPSANGGAAATVQGPGEAARNGAGAYGISSPAPFKKILVSFDTNGTVADGFFELELPAETTSRSIVMNYGPSFPESSFNARFQTVTAAGSVSDAVTIGLRVVSGAEITASMAMTFTPQSPPYLNGAACFLLPGQLCAYEFTVTVRELNGVAVSLTSSQQSFQLPGSGGPRAPALQPTQLPDRGSVNVSTGIACEIGNTVCLPGLTGPQAFTQPTVFSVVYFGTDANGHQVQVSGQIMLPPR